MTDEYDPKKALRAAKKRRPDPETALGYSIRPATLKDVPDMLEIYNHYVANSTVTFDEESLSLKEFREKFKHIEKLGFPWLAAVSDGGQILGYAYASQWRQKAAYRHTVEDSIYLGPAATGRGIGTKLMAEFIEACRAAGIREIIAVIADKGAEASIAMHQNFGFKDIGHMGKVGYKFGRWLGTVLMQKSLK